MPINIDIKFEWPELDKLLQDKQDEIQLFVAGYAQYNRAMMFDAEGASNGHPKWAPLAFRSGMILSDKGVLRKSIAPNTNPNSPASRANGTILEISKDVVTIGTNLMYARLMNDGTSKMPDGVMKATNAKALKIPIPGGANATDGAKGIKPNLKQGKQKFIFRKSVRIPARPFDQWNEQDSMELAGALKNKILEVLNG